MPRYRSLTDEVADDRQRMLAALRRPLMDAQRAFATLTPTQQMEASKMVPHGTTIGAFLVAGGQAVVAFSDGRVSIGSRIASQDYRKVVTLDSHTAMLIAGSPVIAQRFAQMMQVFIRAYQDLRLGKPMSVDAKRKRLARELLGAFGLAAHGLILAPILATYDRGKRRARIFAYGPEGSFSERRDTGDSTNGYATSGSGEGVYKLIKERRRLDMSVDDGVTLAQYLVADSAEDDSGSGGTTFVAVIDRDGIRTPGGGGQ
jgi:20S proteasome alpha/beta subunit